MTEIEFAVVGSNAGIDTGWLPDAAAIVHDLGFSIVTGVHHDDPAATDLVVALRSVPTLRHFDPEEIAYYEPRGARSATRTVDRRTALPFEAPFKWGRISIADRLGRMWNSSVIVDNKAGAGTLLGAETVARDLVRAAIATVFGGHAEVADLKPVIAWFEGGGTLQLSDDAPAALVLEEARKVDGLERALGQMGLAVKKGDLVRAAAFDFILEGLASTRKITRTDEGRFQGVAPERKKIGRAHV